MRFFAHSARPVRKNHTVMLSTNSSDGIVPNRAWPLTELSSFATGSFSNRRTWRPQPSSWAKRAVDEWSTAAGINSGTIFRRVRRLGKIWGDRNTPKAVWDVVRPAAKRDDIKGLAPHDLRRTCARVCHLAGGELSRFNFCLDTHPLRQLNGTSAASRDSAMR